jgi:23S rRNA (adenine2030-N6)-methyltransferase
MLRAELTVAPPADPPRLYGSGMILVNPPFTLEAELSILLPELARIMGGLESGRGAGLRIEWIRGED